MSLKARRNTTEKVEALLNAEVPIVTEWAAFTMVVLTDSAAPTYGTVTRNIARWRRNGPNMEIRWEFQQTSAGTGTGTGRNQMQLPIDPNTSQPYQIDQTQVPANSNSNVSKVGHGGFEGVGRNLKATLHSQSVTSFSAVLHDETSAGFFGPGGIADFDSIIQFSFVAIVPIAGWAAKQTLREQLGL